MYFNTKRNYGIERTNTIHLTKQFESFSMNFVITLKIKNNVSRIAINIIKKNIFLR